MFAYVHVLIFSEVDILHAFDFFSVISFIMEKFRQSTTWREGLMFFVGLQMCMAGFLPFSAIYIELYYIFASVWGHKIYTIYSILFIVFIILIIVTAFITVALTYFQLAIEDHDWWWR
jgi:hypothetical protein